MPTTLDGIINRGERKDPKGWGGFTEQCDYISRRAHFHYNLQSTGRQESGMYDKMIFLSIFSSGNVVYEAPV